MPRGGRAKFLLAAVSAVAVIGTGLIAVKAAEAGVPSGGPPAAAQPATTPTPSLPNTSPFPPSAPTDLVATHVGATSITLAWTASTPGCCAVEGYRITYYRAFYDIAYSSSVGNVTTATLTEGIIPTGQYSVQVSAVDGLGHYSASAAITVVTPLSDTGPDTVPPQAPTNLSATYTPSTTLRWSPSSDNVAVTGYNVYRFDGLFVSTLLATVTGTEYTVPPIVTAPPSSSPSSPPASFNSTYYVRARDAAGNLSAVSNTVPVRPTGPSSPPVSVSPSTPVSPSRSPSAQPPTCTVSYTTQSQWAGGFVASLTVANTGSAPISGWRLAFTFAGDQRITNSWNATFTQSGSAVTVRNADWNAVIAAHGSVSMGMQGTWTTSDAPPPAFLLNDAPCATG
ncbi:hypothetical protein Raf01_40190 [Rugosimonospora africana]|uniref:Fibronectin type III domain-containing protein n=1 Tax=Rugosimonospora africana TaxID=556532 RepID=A0A8J3QTT1_9ACTN|nr:hypothetical protein Raf01_40190 [Rugosimonospora africana]